MGADFYLNPPKDRCKDCSEWVEWIDKRGRCSACDNIRMRDGITAVRRKRDAMVRDLDPDCSREDLDDIIKTMTTMLLKLENGQWVSK